MMLSRWLHVALLVVVMVARKTQRRRSTASDSSVLIGCRNVSLSIVRTVLAQLPLVLNLSLNERLDFQQAADLIYDDDVALQVG